MYPAPDPADAAAPLVQRAEDHLPISYDATFNHFSPVLIKELNRHFLRLKEVEKRPALKTFVHELNQLDADVRELQVKVDLLDDKGRPDDQCKKAYHAALKDEIKAKRQGISALVTKLYADASNLFEQAKASSTWRIVVGIGLLILGTALVAAGIAALVLMPPAILGLPATLLGAKVLEVLGLTALQLNLISGAAVTAGIVKLVGSGVSFFKGASHDGSSSAKAANNALKICTSHAKDALDRIERPALVPKMT